ncbi:hypothetical protein EcWSU1_01947 [Enterobacter ludwigii]|jgi:hypothetical protein|uniref:Uncharacterized protein n=1 Tax=Enterobacter ludwigii TaxID=299767 RepID=G8LMB2_9ENTR|nr:hypothetical protein EcWSU1_01947 [Enterobacter ludwigii]
MAKIEKVMGKGEADTTASTSNQYWALLRVSHRVLLFSSTMGKAILSH